MTKNADAFGDSNEVACRVGVVDVAKFLFGNRAATEKLIACRWAILPAGLLVGTAALCREYDAVSILHSPGDLAAPFGASLALSVFLYVWLLFMPKASRSSDASGDVYDYLVGFLTFLTAYWMTAPLAWLYAIPVEVMMDEYSAIVCNLTFLSIVSLWRVALFARFVSIWYRVAYWVALSWITLPCCVIASAAMALRHFNIVGVMGGIRLTVSEQAIIGFQQGAQNVAFVCGGLAALGALSSYAVPRRARFEFNVASCGLAKGLWYLPLIACVPLAGGLVFFQPKFFRAAVVDQAISSGKHAFAINQIEQAGALSKFPVRWDPLPAPRKPIPHLGGLIAAVGQLEPEPWIADLLLHDADEWLLKEHTYPHYEPDPDSDSVAESLAKIIKAERLPEVLQAAEVLRQLPSPSEAVADKRAQLVAVLQEAIQVAERSTTVDDEE